ncbi:MAG: oxidoreductase [Chitinophagaceae bacterium]|jgi:protein-disulfide isomerase|nr:oxidoreductase [Chitinophagaceae bacterium]
MAISKGKEIIEPGDVFIGNKNAPVTITFYVDYESLACAAANEVVKAVYEITPGRVRLNIRHFPLSNRHQKAMKAAEAAVAASQEGKLWELHNLMFYHRKQLGLISLKKYAKEAGISSMKFFDELVNGRYAWQVRGDLMGALGKGIRDVPAILVNNHLFEEAVSVENLERFIQDVLAISEE